MIRTLQLRGKVLPKSKSQMTSDLLIIENCHLDTVLEGNFLEEFDYIRNNYKKTEIIVKAMENEVQCRLASNAYPAKRSTSTCGYTDDLEKPIA